MKKNSVIIQIEQQHSNLLTTRYGNICQPYEPVKS